MKLFPADTATLLEFDKVLAEVARQCRCTLGLDRVQKVRPMDNYDEITKLLLQTKEMAAIEVYEEKFPDDTFYDIRETITFLAIENYVLHEEQFHFIKKTSTTAGNIIRFLTTHVEKYPALSTCIRNCIYEKSIAQEIGKILDDDGKIRPNASPELIRIRKESDTCTRELSKAFNAALSKYRKAGYLSDVDESMRNNRRVLGILSEYKRQLRGIIHDESETGKTTFIEPEEVVTIQNKLFELDREEKREIYKILKTLTQIIAPYKSNLESYQHVLGVIDFTRAKALYALAIEATMPQVEKFPIIYLHNAYHPILFQLNKKQKKEIIPLTVEMDADKRILVISGPNAGGKSVAMKTIGLLQMMMQSGLLITVADQSRMGIFKRICCDIGDTQSLEDELSTYSSRLMKLNYFLKFADKHTLILIDEFGSGTDPVSGGAIAEASLHALNTLKVFGVITTHYPNLKAFASNTIGVFNGSMLYHETALRPLYILETGKPGSSYAFEIATKSELPATLIDHAKSLLSKEHIRFEELLKNVRIEKEHIKLREKELQKKDEDLKKKEADLQQELEKTKEKQQAYHLKKLEKQDEAIRALEIEFKTLTDALKQTHHIEGNTIKTEIKQFLQQNRKKIFNERKTQYTQETKHQKKGEIKIGGPVKLISGSETGILKAIHKSRATVIFNNMLVTVPVDELVGIEKIENPQHIAKPKMQVDIEQEDVDTQLDLRGKAKEEAMMALENYLDKAMMRNMYEVRILHGKGTGVLREAVQQIIKKHSGIKEYNYEERNMGGDGVTVIKF